MSATLTKKQREVIEASNVTLIGFDERNRPVVEVTIRRKIHRWAVLPDGQNVSVSGGITFKL